MRISDWSSDVCSSDLFLIEGPEVPGIVDAALGRVQHRPFQMNADDARDAFSDRLLDRSNCGSDLVDVVRNQGGKHGAGSEASVRLGQDRKSTRLNSSH